MKINPLKASEISLLINGRLQGDGDRSVESICKIDDADPKSLCFLGNMKYEKFLYSQSDITVLVENGFQPRGSFNNTLIYVDDVYSKFSKVLKKFESSDEHLRVISELSSIHDSTILGEEVGVGKFSIIEAGSSVGDKSIIMDQVYIGKNVTLGKKTKIYPGVRILDRTVIGDHVTIHANAVIGSDGFGFSPNNKEYDKIPQLGNVLIEDWVEIGSGTTIDRATIGSTIVKKGVKLDNLIQIGHNVIIGENTVIAAQTGVAGSTEIGKSSRLGGQVGISGHLTIAPHSQIQAKSGIASSIEEPGKKWYGYPIISYTRYLRSYAIFKMLPQVLSRIARIEKKLDKK